MDKEAALDIVRQYKQVVKPYMGEQARFYIYGSYSKGCQHPDSDIDVAVVIPSIGNNWLNLSQRLWRDVDKVDVLIESVLLEDSHPSPLYEDVMLIGVAV